MMRRRSQHIVFRILAWFVVVSQVASSAAYADTKSLNKVSTLAPPSIFEKSFPDERSEQSRNSILSHMKLLTAVFSIGAHFLVDDKEKLTLSRTIRDEFRNNPSFLEGIDLENVRREGHIVYIPYKRGGSDYEIKVCSRERLEGPAKAGPEWAVIANWGVQIIERGKPVVATRASARPLTVEAGPRRSTSGSSGQDDEIRRAMRDDDWKYLLDELKAASLGTTEADEARLHRLLTVCNEVSNAQPSYPVESRYPILRAVALLRKEEQDTLVSILNKNRELRWSSVLIDSILLMLEKEIPDDWFDHWAPNLKGRTIWQVASEIWYPGGGLGRVMQYDGIAMLEFLEKNGIRLCHVEPYYQVRRDKDGNLIPIEYSRLPVPLVGFELVERFPIKIGSRTTEALCFRARNPFGVENYLIRDAEWYSTKMMYNYGTEDNPVSWEEFSEFLSLASLELVHRIEEKKKNENPQWKPPVIHTNDAQVALFDLFRKIAYPEDDPIFQDSMVAFTTHTYPNRKIYDYGTGRNVLSGWNISQDNWKYFEHMGMGWTPVLDITSAGLRTADWAGGVSAKHIDDVASYDQWAGVNFTAVTNGDLRAFTADIFREIMLGLFLDADVEHPTPEQVLATKKEAKRRLGQELKERLNLAENPIDEERPIVSYSGRLVQEKAGRERAFTDENIEELVKMGVQVVIYGNVQTGDERSLRLAQGLSGLRDSLDRKNYPGKLVFVGSFGIKEQKLLLAATDIQVQDSDAYTEAAGFTESDIAVCGGLELAPPWKEGILQAQGVRINLDMPGEGNTLIPEDARPESYLKILKVVLAKTPEELSEYQATSVRLSRVLEARLTAAEYLRQWSQAIGRRGSSSGIQPQKSYGYALGLTGEAIDEQEHQRINAILRELILNPAGNVRSLFDKKIHLIEGDIDIEQDRDDRPFFIALRGLKNRLPPDLGVIIVNDDSGRLPPHIVLHPGAQRHQAYIPRSYLNALADIYSELDEDQKKELIELMFEAFHYEDTRINLRQYKSTLGGQGPPIPEISEIELSRTAPSFRARELFRTIYAFHKIGAKAKPDIKKFLSILKANNREKISYLNAYTDLTVEQHLEMAKKFIEKNPSRIDIILAQHHLGAVFNHLGAFENLSGQELDIWNEAVKVLKSEGVIDKGPETDEPFSAWKFIRELIRQNMLIELGYPPEKGNVKAKSLEQFEPWIRGTQTQLGDSVYYPMPGEKTALPVDIKEAIRRIMEMSELDNDTKTDIIASLKPDESGNGIIISRETLERIGTPLMAKCTLSVSAAGKGTRYAEVSLDDEGNKIIKDTAKAIYKIPVDGGRSILEVLIAQIRGLNNKYSVKMPLDIYTSDFTHDDIDKEASMLGFNVERIWRFIPVARLMPIARKGIHAVYTHPAKGSPRTHLTRTRRAFLFDASTSDFLKNVLPSLPWAEHFWPDAHDSAFIDFIVNGRAYESIQEGFRYKFTANVDNRKGVPSPTLLAMMKLTGAPLIIEGGLSKGQIGGAFVNFRRDKVPDAINFGNVHGILEGDEFDKEFSNSLTQEDMDRYFPLFNFAGYTDDIIEFTRSAFMPGLSDDEVIARLKEFYDASVRDDREKLAELRFKLEDSYRRRTQRFERDKRYPAYQSSNLAGTLSWRLPTLVVEAPAGERFGPLKENIVNLKREMGFIQSLLTYTPPETRLREVSLPAERATRREEAELEHLQTTYRNKPDLVLGELLQDIARRIKELKDIFAYIETKTVLDYGQGIVEWNASRQSTSPSTGEAEHRGSTSGAEPKEPSQESLKEHFQTKSRRNRIAAKLEEKPPTGDKWTIAMLADSLKMDWQTIYNDLKARGLLTSERLDMKGSRTIPPATPGLSQQPPPDVTDKGSLGASAEQRGSASGMAGLDDALKRNIIKRIQESGGRITFEEFQRMSLYGKDGYYTGGRVQFSEFASGDDGITFTSNAKKPAIGWAFARLFYRQWKEMGEPQVFHIVEQGGGDGSMALNVLAGIKNLGDLGEEGKEHRKFYNSVKYTILDISGRLSKNQMERLENRHPNVNCVTGSALQMPFQDESVEGVFFSNELPDSFPVHRIVVRDGALKEIYIKYEGGEFKEDEGELSTDEMRQYFDELVGKRPPEGKEFAVNLYMRNWMKELHRVLKRGFVMTVDYGFKETQQRYDSRNEEAVWNFSGRPILRPGIDSTHNVDFETLNKVGVSEGFKHENLSPLDRLLDRTLPGAIPVNDEEYVLLLSKGIDSVNRNMDLIHKANLDLLPPLENGKTLWHVIPVSLIPQNANYNQQTKFIEFVNRLNRDYPNVREKIRIVTDRQNLAEVVKGLLSNPNNIVDVALDNESWIAELPLVNMLVFKPKDGKLGDFRQLEGILAALRALHIKDRSQMKERLSKLHELLTGESKNVPDIEDSKEFARQFIFVLPPIKVENYEDLRKMNERLLQLIQSA